MARRMFSPDIVESEEFLTMPATAQVLYFHLGMKADDDGFIQPRIIMKTLGSSEDDLKVLLAKRFILPFESGVVVIKHWLIHNMVRLDRYRPTRFVEEKNALFIKENKAYTDMATNGQPIGNHPAPQVRLGKDSLYLPTSSEKKEATPFEEEPEITRESDADEYRRPRKAPDKNAALILKEQETRQGRKFVNQVKQMSAIKSMIEAGYTKKQILEEYGWLERQKYWSDKGVDFLVVASQIHKEHA